MLGSFKSNNICIFLRKCPLLGKLLGTTKKVKALDKTSVSSSERGSEDRFLTIFNGFKLFICFVCNNIFMLIRCEVLELG